MYSTALQVVLKGLITWIIETSMRAQNMTRSNGPFSVNYFAKKMGDGDHLSAFERKVYALANGDPYCEGQ
jgi:hypothetical protein